MLTQARGWGTKPLRLCNGQRTDPFSCQRSPRSCKGRGSEPRVGARPPPQLGQGREKLLGWIQVEQPWEKDWGWWWANMDTTSWDFSLSSE